MILEPLTNQVSTSTNQTSVSLLHLQSSTNTSPPHHHQSTSSGSQNHLILNLNSETGVYGTSEWINTFTFSCLIFLFCLIVFIFSFMFLLSFRCSMARQKGSETKTLSSKAAKERSQTDSPIDSIHSAKCQSVFVSETTNKKFPTSINNIIECSSSTVSTTPCAITSLEDDRRQADEVEQERELTLYISSSAYHQDHFITSFPNSDPLSLSIGFCEGRTTPMSNNYSLVEQKSKTEFLPVLKQNYFKSLDHHQNSTTLKNQKSYLKPQKLRQYKIKIHSNNEIKNNKFHNSYSEVIEELKNRFIFDTVV